MCSPGENNENVVEDDTEENDALENPENLLKGKEIGNFVFFKIFLNFSQN